MTNKEELKNLVTQTLTNMGFTEIDFPVYETNKVVVVFNGKEVTSFTEDLAGWTNPGIQLDESGKREYKMEFSKGS